MREELAGRLLQLYQDNRADDWRWFEPGLTYCNAALPHSLLMCGQSIPNAAMTAAGLTVVKLDPKATAEFRGAAEKLAGTLRGGMIPADVYDLAVRERDAFRKAKPAK